MVQNKDHDNDDTNKSCYESFVMFPITCFNYCSLLNPFAFYRRLYNEDKLSSYFWVFIFFSVNIIIFVYTLNFWYTAVYKMEHDLKHGTLEIDCNSFICHVNRKAVRYGIDKLLYTYICICINHNRLLINAIMYLGPLSRFSPWAKACGGCLNFDCSIILLPVIRLLLRKINNWGQSFSLAQQNNGK